MLDDAVPPKELKTKNHGSQPSEITKQGRHSMQ